MDEGAHARTRPSNTTQGDSASAEKTAETGLGGRGSGARNVCSIIGRRWNEASSGCCGAGWDSGKYSSNKSNFKGEYEGDPRINDTFKGADPVGGRDAGGLFMFCNRHWVKIYS
jgi:hypothetical protein